MPPGWLPEVLQAAAGERPSRLHRDARPNKLDVCVCMGVCLCVSYIMVYPFSQLPRQAACCRLLRHLLRARGLQGRCTAGTG